MRWKAYLCVFLFPSFLLGEPSICLNMIVKNESHVIKRALDSAKEWIDYWVIVDTGSTDGTQEIIKEHMQGIPGQLHERPWKNFAHNRNEALELAKPHGEYLLFLDADDWLEPAADFQFPELIDDVYSMTWHHGDFSYCKPQLIRSSLPWHWVGVLHEYLACDRPFLATPLLNIKYIYGGDGARSHDPAKYLQAASILQEALKEEPQNTRYVFYLAESLRDAGKIEEAIQCYLQRAAMGGWEEEVFWALFQSAQLKNASHYPIDEVIQSYYRAHCVRPHRAEPVYYLAKLFNENRKFVLAYSCIKGYLHIPQPSAKDILFCADWIQEYGLDFELALSAYYVGQTEEFSELSRQLLRQPNLPLAFKTCVENNLRLTSSQVQ